MHNIVSFVNCLEPNKELMELMEKNNYKKTKEPKNIAKAARVHGPVNTHNTTVFTLLLLVPLTQNMKLVHTIVHFVL